MTNITTEITERLYGTHTYETDTIKISHFEQDITEEFTKDVRNWFSGLSVPYRDALIAINFDRTIATSMMFFTYQDSLAWEYDCLTRKLVRYITAEDTIADYEKPNGTTPIGLRSALSNYIYLKKTRETIIKENDKTLSLLSPELKNKVIQELCDRNGAYQYHLKMVVKVLTDYRKDILHDALTAVIKEVKKEG